MIDYELAGSIAQRHVGLTVWHVECLQALASEPGPARTEHLGARLKQYGPTVRNWLEWLVGRNLARCERVSGERTARLWVITDLGREWLRVSEEMARENGNGHENSKEGCGA